MQTSPELIQIQNTPDEGQEVLIGEADFYCGVCNQIRRAHIFGSGHVIDLQKGQEITVESVVKRERDFQNLYLLSPQLMSVRTTVEGTELIQRVIAETHMEQFHVSIGNVLRFVSPE